MKRTIFSILILTFFSVFSYAKVINDSQIIPGNHWIYDDFKKLSSEQAIGAFTTNTPVSVGELKLHLKDFDKDILSDSGREVYDRVEDFLYNQTNLFPIEPVYAGLDVNLAPEFLWKSNDKIDWTYNYFYKDWPLFAQIDLGISNYFTIGGDFFIGKNYKASNENGNLTNIPINYDQFEFMFPRFGYGSLGITFADWGVNLTAGKEGLQIGNTLTGSIIYNNTFETDNFLKLEVYSNLVKYTGAIMEIGPEKILYWHQIDVRFFKKFKFGAMEGALINNDFDIRFLNPIMIFHSYAFWKNFSNETEDHYYNESHACSYLGVTLEFNPVEYLRLYGLYAMNEIQLPNEQHGKWLSYPDSLGGQLGAELTIPSSKGGYWKSNLEAVYTSPFLYIKQAPEWSLYKQRKDNVTWQDVNSWIGSPFGPDTFAVTGKFGYEQQRKWSVYAGYMIKLQGENGFNLFNEKKNVEYKGKSSEVYTYYPYTKYTLADDVNDQSGRDAALKEGRNMWMTGICEYKNQISLDGSYCFTDRLSLDGQFIYTFVFNNKNTADDFQQGIQCSLSGKWIIY